MQENQEELSLKDIFGLLISKIWFIIILGAVGFVIAFCISKFVMPLKYSSSVSMYVKSTATKEEQNVNLNELNASKSLVTTYIVSKTPRYSKRSETSLSTRLRQTTI